MKNSLDKTREIRVLLSQIKVFCEMIHEILDDAHTAETGRYSCFKDMAVIYNDFAERAKNVLNVTTMFYTFNLGEIPSWGASVCLHKREY